MKTYLEKTQNIWKANLLFIFLSAVALVFMEWLFITTKPSFLSGTLVSEKLLVLFWSEVLVFGVLLFLSLPVVVACSFINNKKAIAILLAIIPSITLGFSLLLVIDNFTYTLLKFGVVNTTGITQGMYLLAWCILLAFIFQRLRKAVDDQIQKPLTCQLQTFLLPVLTLFFAIAIPIAFLQFPKHVTDSNPLDADLNTTPNIILFTADGLNADHMSLYGYERETTPFLDSIKEDLIIGQNHFTNSANTSGSIVSIMTGKYPTTTRLLYPPNVLKGTDSLEHLPGILKSRGYYTAQFAVKHYVDSSVQNLLNSFDESNSVRKQANLAINFLNKCFSMNAKLFLNEIESRLIVRLKHLFFVQAMENTFLQITETQKDFKDDEKVLGALEVIKSKPEPVFVHIHWMGTHGDRFYPDSKIFTKNMDPEKQIPWDTNFYDDAIVDLDAALKDMFEALSDIGEIENTIVVFTSDHGQRFSVENRIPLFIYFPGRRGTVELISNNTQNINIAPTILALLGTEKPKWMSGGHSILSGDQSNEFVISTGTFRSKSGESGWTLAEEYLEPPFYQFDFMNVIDCDRYYRLNLEDLTWSGGIVPSYVGTCNEAAYATGSEIRGLIINRLIEDGFEFDQNEIPEIN